MSQVSTNEFKVGMKIEMDGNPYIIATNEFVKPGKGQAFNRTRLKHLISGRIVDKTFKSGEKFDVADVLETSMRMLYRDGNDLVLMDDTSFEQVTVEEKTIEDVAKWLKEDTLYDVIFYNGTVVQVLPPTFMELSIEETVPGEKGDTASGRVLKPATTETGAKVQVPLFINEGDIVKFDTRSGDYVSRVSK